MSNSPDPDQPWFPGPPVYVGVARQLSVGDAVRKRSGYDFPGVVRSVFQTSAGSTRIVVEMNGSGGLLHIFNPEQLERT